MTGSAGEQWPVAPDRIIRRASHNRSLPLLDGINREKWPDLLDCIIRGRTRWSGQKFPGLDHPGKCGLMPQVGSSGADQAGGAPIPQTGASCDKWLPEAK